MTRPPLHTSGPMATTAIRLPDALRASLQVIADREGRPLSDVIRRTLTLGIDADRARSDWARYVHGRLIDRAGGMADKAKRLRLHNRASDVLAWAAERAEGARVPWAAYMASGALLRAPTRVPARKQ